MNVTTLRSPLAWIIGSGGLLGHAVRGAADGRVPLFAARTYPWGSGADVNAVLRDDARRFRSQAGSEPWQVLWCAGAGYTGASRQQLEEELRALTATLAGLGAPAAGGAVFFASSVGGVYAGAGAPPFSEASPVRALSAYGEAKLAAESLLRSWSQRTGGSVLIGRIANLYGPGQQLAKPQGLVSQLCAAHLRREPLSLWVPLDTLRDYVYAPDCGGLILDALDRLRSERGPVTVTKIMATGRPISIGAVLGEVRRVLRRAPDVVLGSHPTSALQSRDLTTRSSVWLDLDRRAWTPLPAGIHATWLDLQRRFLATRPETVLEVAGAGGQSSDGGRLRR